MAVNYQTVYIDSDAVNWEDRIILFRDTFPDPTTNQIILQSLNLMDKPAAIICGTEEQLNAFAKLLAKADQKSKLGNLSIKEIYNAICKVGEEAKIKIVFIQNIPSGAE